MKKTLMTLAALALSIPAFASVQTTAPAAATQADQHARKDRPGVRCYRDANGNKVCVPSGKT